MTESGPSPQKTDEILEAAEDSSNRGTDLYEREELKEERIRFVLFRLAQEWYGVEITRVKEVIKAGKITYLPSSPGHIAGIVNLRGNILSVTDLKALFHLPHEEPVERSRIIAVESGRLETGLLVDEAVESIEIPASKIEPPLLTLSVEGVEYLKGQCNIAGRLIALIDVERILEQRT